MEFSEYKSKRDFLALAVIATIKEVGLSLYGSFLTRCFHLPLSLKYSYSDIDLIADKMLDEFELIETKNFIRKRIYDDFGLNFRISIRNRGLFQSIETQASEAVAILEALSSFMKKPHDVYYNHYQLNKLYLKIVHPQTYFSVGLGIDEMGRKNKLYKKCCEIKTRGGLFSSREVAECINEIETMSIEIGTSIRLLVYSGVFVGDFCQQYFSILAKCDNVEHILDLENKIKSARKNKIFNWETEKFQPLF